MIAAGGGTAAAQATLADIAAAAGARQAGQAGLFGTMEFQAASLRALPQWNRVLEKMRTEKGQLLACAREPGRCSNATLRSFRDGVAPAAGLGRRQQVETVNRYFNRWPYKLDQEIYGVSEYWATPSEFLSKSGDCEDYAIVKFYALQALGFRNDEMRVVALFDRIRGIGHAVLAVYIDNDILILDNLSDFVFSHSRYGHYEPQYSVNETDRWAHIGRPGGSPAPATRPESQPGTQERLSDGRQGER
jgi:predicted transglutaminase-like cysteine proteinase